MSPAERGRPLVALVGNPNTGKTLLFNRLSGQNARVGNYPGVTVERRLGQGGLPGGREVDLLDVPGTYSLSARSGEEQVAIRSLLGWGTPAPDMVVVVLDATQLARNLYLAVQIRELGLRCVLALNMIDEVEGPRPDARRLGERLGVPCVPVSARTREGLDDLKAAIDGALAAPPPPPLELPWPEPVRRALARVEPLVRAAWQVEGQRARALALWALASLDELDELQDIPAELREAVIQARQEAGDLDLPMVATRYALIDADLAFARPGLARRTLTERLDRVLLHPVAGFAVFLALMGLVFQSLFAGADPFIGLIEDAVAAFSAALATVLPEGVLTDLLLEGVIGGVGNVIVFLPQILLLFFFIGLLEDSGYMARAAYLMDRVMKALGLHGRAFVPMMSGYACAVPAILATRTMERQRDRLLTMMVVPLMSCSARLPVYTLVIAALFPPSLWGGRLPVQGLMLTGMYLFSTAMALTAAAVLGRTVLKGPRVPFLIELPPIRLPSLQSVLRLMWSRSRAFLREAGTVILAFTILLWAALSFPRLPAPEGLDETQEAAFQARALEHSLAGRVGKAIEPAIAPLGFDWKIGVGLIGAFGAREVFVSTMGLVYGIGEDADEQSEPLRERIRAERRPDGSPRYTPLVGLSLMVFFALAAQCMSTLAVVRRETASWRWPMFLFAWMTTLAWLSSLLVYQGGRLLGFS